MYRTFLRYRFAVASLTGVLAACQADNPIGLAEPEMLQVVSSKSPVRTSAIRPYDDALAELADSLPGFGGLFLDSAGVLNVYLTKLDHANIAPGVIGRFYQSRAPNQYNEFQKALSGLKAIQGQYNYRQLNEWYYRIVAEIPRSGIAESDISEQDNRIVIGVLDSRAAQRVAESISTLGIPSEAVTVRVVEPTVISAALRDGVRPTSAGLQVETMSGTCTLGYNAHATHPIGGVDTTYGILITNSHCAPQFGVATGAFIGQPTMSSPVASEIIDPPLFSHSHDPRCPPGRQCRYSDATAFQYFDNNIYQFGRSARTGGWKQFNIVGYNWFLGTNYLNPFLPGFFQLYMVGRTTGYHSASGQSTCVDVTQYTLDFYGNPIDTGRDMLCQSRANLLVEGGDSGAPIHNPPQNQVDIHLYGINWGGNQTSNVYSPVYYIENEILQESGLRLVPCNYYACLAVQPYW